MTWPASSFLPGFLACLLPLPDPIPSHPVPQEIFFTVKGNEGATVGRMQESDTVV